MPASNDGPGSHFSCPGQLERSRMRHPRFKSALHSSSSCRIRASKRIARGGLALRGPPICGAPSKRARPKGRQTSFWLRARRRWALEANHPGTSSPHGVNRLGLSRPDARHRHPRSRPTCPPSTCSRRNKLLRLRGLVVWGGSTLGRATSRHHRPLLPPPRPEGPPRQADAARISSLMNQPHPFGAVIRGRKRRARASDEWKSFSSSTACSRITQYTHRPGVPR